MRIICGTDFSVHADAAAMATASLAARLELPVTLAHVIDPKRYVNPSVDLMAHLRRTRQRKLQALAARVGQAGVIAKTAIMEGSPALKLTELASRSGARLLVVSARGQIAPTQWLTGSVTDQVVQTSVIPTLVVRNAGSFGRWLQGKKPLRVMVGYDFSASSEAAIRWVASLNAIARCEIHIVYFAPAAGDQSRFGMLARFAPLSFPSTRKRLLEKQILQRTSSVLGTEARISVRAGGGRANWQLIEKAAEHGVELMVVGASQRRGLARLGSVSRAVLHYFQQNVASVPDGWLSGARETSISRDSVRRTLEHAEQPREDERVLVQQE